MQTGLLELHAALSLPFVLQGGHAMLGAARIFFFFFFFQCSCDTPSHACSKEAPPSQRFESIDQFEHSFQKGWSVEIHVGDCTAMSLFM
jgi:hypothetical protein